MKFADVIFHTLTAASRSDNEAYRLSGQSGKRYWIAHLPGDSLDEHALNAAEFRIWAGSQKLDLIFSDNHVICRGLIIGEAF